VKLEASVVGCTTGSRGEVPGERKPVIRDDDDDAAAAADDDDKHTKTTTL
jgi:hypothetical protein